MFVDHVKLQLKAGKGGNGVVAWRREKYLPKGGPAGGDGGFGGTVILEADDQVYSLDAYRNRRLMHAENGQDGSGGQKRGRKGRDLVLKVPCGTLVKKLSDGSVLCDLTEPKQQYVICRGGKGGKGNTHFKSPTNRAPRIATLGIKGTSCSIELELKLIADVGLVGFPNAGKSTLVSTLTDVNIKIAPYPFTTLRPNLGYVMGEYGERLLIADIPGIIQGAHQNRGLGLEFLRHIERTSLLVFVVDTSQWEGRDPIDDYRVLREEITAYHPELAQKPFVLALNKIDLTEKSKLEEFQKLVDSEIFEICALTGEGTQALLGCLKRKLNK